MLITVVIPVHNRPDLFARALRSVRAQRGIAADAVEIVVVDDGSNPPVRLDGADRRVRIVRLEHNAGPAAARNAGVKAAKGDYIAFLDSDDAWLADKLARQIDALRRIEGTDGKRPSAMVCGFYYPNRSTGRLEARMPRPAEQLVEFASGCWFAPGSVLPINRSVFEMVGPLDERLRRLEDLDWFIRFGQQGGRLHVLNDMGAIIAPSKSASYAAIEASATVIESKFDAVLSSQERRRLKAYLALERGAALLLQGNRFEAFGYLLKSFLYRPRRQAAVLSFWQRSAAVPQEVLRTYAAMLDRA